MARFADVALVVHKAVASKLGQNIISNYLSVVWLGGLSLALIPIYLRLLGPAQWGLVAVCMSIQGFMSLLDMGLALIMPRDIARAGTDHHRIARSFVLYSRAYLTLGLLGCVLGQLAVPWLVHSWLHQGSGTVGGGVVFRLVLLQFAFQFSNNAHIGYWNGVQAQRLANIRQCSFATIKHICAISAVVFVAANATSYLVPFVVGSAVEFAINRWTIRRQVKDVVVGHIGFADYRGLAINSGLLAAGISVGMLISQVDRIFLMRTVDIASFGRYVIVANLGLAFLQLQYPLVRAYFPRIVQSRDRHDMSAMRQLAAGAFVLCILPCLLTAVVAPWVLQTWTHNRLVTQEGAMALRLILCSVAINAVYQLIYQRIISHGSPILVLQINIAVLLTLIPVAYFATSAWGITGGGVTWLAGSLIQLCIGTALARRGNL